MPPEKITPENLDKALRKMDPIQKNYMTICEPCIANCPAHHFSR